MLRYVVVLVLGLSYLTGTSAFSGMSQLERDYKSLEADILINKGAVSKIENFTYQKDVATFYFEKGTILFQRNIDNRPTAAFFVGKGRLIIEVPSRMERNSLRLITRDSTVDEEFSVCVIRFADDFDRLVCEQFGCEEGKLPIRDFKKLKKAMGERYFNSLPDYQYEIYFQLLRSAYTRTADGFFWSCANRYMFSFDPNRGEEARIFYEREKTAIYPGTAVILQRKENQAYDLARVSYVTYPVRPLDKKMTLELGGEDGNTILSGSAVVTLLVERDSLKSAALSLAPRLKLDSITYENKKIGFVRRKNFSGVGMILPETAYHGDTLRFVFYYHGSNYSIGFPTAESPVVCSHSFDMTYSKGNNLFLLNHTPSGQIDDDREHCLADIRTPCNPVYYVVLRSGLDTVKLETDHGLTINFVETRASKLWMKEEYRVLMAKAFDYLQSQFGPPSTDSRDFYALEGIINFSNEGFMVIPIGSYLEEYGGYARYAGNTVAQQWFGNMARIRSHRDVWMRDAIPEYLGMQFIQNSVGNKEFYTNLVGRRDRIGELIKERNSFPLGVGRRGSVRGTIHRGVWFLHMLRMMMIDLRTFSDSTFIGFLNDVIETSHKTDFSTAEFQQIAENSMGGSLDWFFAEWMEGIEIPTYDVSYAINKTDEGYFVDFDIVTKDVPPDFVMPVIIRISFDEGDAYFRKPVASEQLSFSQGPYPYQPKEVVFNELYSVLCNLKIKKR